MKNNNVEDIWIRPGRVLKYENGKVDVDSFGAVFKSLPVFQLLTSEDYKFHVPCKPDEQGLILKVLGSKKSVFLKGIFTKHNMIDESELDKLSLIFNKSKILVEDLSVNLKSENINLESENAMNLKSENINLESENAMNLKSENINLESENAMNLKSENINLESENINLESENINLGNHLKIENGALIGGVAEIAKFFASVKTSNGGNLISAEVSGGIKEISKQVKKIDNDIKDIKAEIEKIKDKKNEK